MAEGDRLVRIAAMLVDVHVYVTAIDELLEAGRIPCAGYELERRGHGRKRVSKLHEAPPPLWMTFGQESKKYQLRR